MPNPLTPEQTAGLKPGEEYALAKGLAGRMSIGELEQASSALNNPEKPATVPNLDGLAGFVKTKFERAKLNRKTIIEDKLNAVALQVRGQYDAAKLAKIAKTPGSQLFFKLTKTKCSAALAWMMNILSQQDGKLFSLKPTPMPDLPEEHKRNIEQKITEEYAAGALADADVWGRAQRLRDDIQHELMKDAEACAKRMEDKIEDQLNEGGFYSALNDYLQYLTESVFAVMKGPVWKKDSTVNWVSTTSIDPKTGATIKKSVPKKQDRIIPTWYAVAPHDFYWDPNIKNVDQGWIFEVINPTCADLADFKGIPGYNDANIDAIINDQTPFVQGDEDYTVRADFEKRDPTTNLGLPEDTRQMIEGWGKIQGKYLKEYKILDKVEDNAYYNINVIFGGDKVIYAKLNPHPTGNKPYFVGSFFKEAGSFIGTALAQAMDDVQEICNGIGRSAINNISISSYPLGSYDSTALDPDCSPDELYPGKMFSYDGTQVSGSIHKPVEFFFLQCNADILLKAFEFFASMADDRTLVPRYAQGNGAMSGAGSTAHGMDVLMDSALKCIRLVLAHEDIGTIQPAIYYLYVLNMLDPEVPENCKGDCRIVPQGVIATLVKEGVKERQIQLVQTLSGDPNVFRLVGLKGLAKFMREMLQNQGVRQDLIPTDEQIEIQLAEEAARMAQGALPTEGAPGTPPPEEMPVSVPPGAPIAPPPSQRGSEE